MKAARIIVLLIAVVAGGFAALLAGSSDQGPAPAPEVAKVATADVLVAKTDISMGQIITAQELEWQAWPEAAANVNFVRRADKANAIEEFSGAIARTPFVVGEPIREAKLVRANGSGFLAAILPSGKRAISTEISPETGAGGFILPNDHVDVILTRRATAEGDRRPGVNSHSSETILSNVKVLAIDQTIEEKNGQRVVVGKTATLELTQRQAEALALARQLGTISLALRSLADVSVTAETEDLKKDDGRREVNMVRFGVTTLSGQR